MRRFLLFGVSLVGAFCLLEGALHTDLAEQALWLPMAGFKAEFNTPWLREVGGYRTDQVLGWIGQPATRRWDWGDDLPGVLIARRNNLGLAREDDTAVRKPPGMFRLIVLGDSQTEGFANTSGGETFSSVLESVAGARGGSAKVQVLNAAVAGYSPWQQFLWVRLHGKKFQPDLVILGIYLGNDILDMTFDRTIASLGTWERVRTGSWKLPLLMEWARHGKLRSEFHQEGESPVSLPWPRLDGLTWRQKSMWSQIVAEAYAAHRFPREMARGMTRLEHTLSITRETVLARGRRLAVILIPSKYQTEPEECREGMPELLDRVNLPLHAVHYEREAARAIAAICERLDIPALDLTACLREHHRTTGERIHGYLSWHLTADGHKAIGTHLFRWLQEQHLLP